MRLGSADVETGTAEARVLQTGRFAEDRTINGHGPSGKSGSANQRLNLLDFQQTLNLGVVGSTPAGLTKVFDKLQRDLCCNSYRSSRPGLQWGVTRLVGEAT
jgi:hypothetical protein